MIVKKLKHAQEGIAHLAIIIMIAIFAIGGATTFVIMQQSNGAEIAQEDDNLNDEGEEDQDPQTTVDNEDQPVNDDGSL